MTPEALATRLYGQLYAEPPCSEDKRRHDIGLLAAAFMSLEAEEREACARLAEAFLGASSHSNQHEIAAAIRARTDAHLREDGR